MSRNKKQYKADIFASIGKDDKFGMVYDGLYQSKAFNELPLSVKHFYTLCRIQAKSSHGTSCLYKHGKEYGITYTENDFVFPASHMRKYGVDRSNGFKCLKKLIEAGFIDKKEKNKHMYKVNVYSFSKRWKEQS